MTGASEVDLEKGQEKTSMAKQRKIVPWLEKHGCRNIAAQRRLKEVVTEERRIEKVAVKEKWGESSEDL